MSQWSHPDELDRIAARAFQRNGRTPASPAEVGEALRKALITGGLRRIPKHPNQRDIVLAILCLKLRRRHPYAEPELNRDLRQALALMNAAVDHVSCRRYLVDLGFVRRNRSGTRYLLDYARVASALSEEAVVTADAQVEAALRRTPR